jgi:hypothetical protein
VAHVEAAAHTAVRPNTSPEIWPKVESSMGAGSFAKESPLSFLFTKVLVALFIWVMKFTLASLYIYIYIYICKWVSFNFLKLNTHAQNKAQNNRGHAPGLAWVKQ